MSKRQPLGTRVIRGHCGVVVAPVPLPEHDSEDFHAYLASTFDRVLMRDPYSAHKEPPKRAVTESSVLRPRLLAFPGLAIRRASWSAHMDVGEPRHNGMSKHVEPENGIPFKRSTYSSCPLPIALLWLRVQVRGSQDADALSEVERNEKTFHFMKFLRSVAQMVGNFLFRPLLIRFHTG